MSSSENAASNQAHGESGRARGATRVLGDILQDLRTQQGAAEPKRRASDHEVAEAKIGDVIDRLDERAFGFLLLLLALPCCLPFVYILPQIVALPMLALAGQLVAGKTHPWLPARLHERKFAIASFEKVLGRAEKYVGWIEKIARPRLLPVTGHLGGRIVGVLLLIPTASILVPLPSTNTMPGIGVAIASLGMIERDGVLVIAGLLIGLAWVALLAFLGLEAATLIKDWVSSLA